MADACHTSASLRTALTAPAVEAAAKRRWPATSSGRHVSALSGRAGRPDGRRALVQPHRVRRRARRSGGVQTVVTVADQAAGLDRLEADLFAFGQVVAVRAGAARGADRPGGAGGATAPSWPSSLLAGGPAARPQQLVGRVIAAPRGLSFETALRQVSDEVAARRERRIATVVSAIALTDAQRERLLAALQQQVRRAGLPERRHRPRGDRWAAGHRGRPGHRRHHRHPAWTRRACVSSADRPTTRRDPADARRRAGRDDGAHDPSGGDPGRAGALRRSRTPRTRPPRGGRRGRRGRRRHRPRRGAALGHDQRAAASSRAACSASRSNLDVREIGAVLLGEFSDIEEGQEVRRTGEILSVPGRRRLPRPRGRPARQPDRRARPDRARGAPRPGAAGAHGGRSASR